MCDAVIPLEHGAMTDFKRYLLPSTALPELGLARLRRVPPAASGVARYAPIAPVRRAGLGELLATAGATGLDPSRLVRRRGIIGGLMTVS